VGSYGYPNIRLFVENAQLAVNPRRIEAARASIRQIGKYFIMIYQYKPRMTQTPKTRRQVMSFTAANLGLLALSPVQAAVCNPKSNSMPNMDVFYRSPTRASKKRLDCGDIKSSTEQDIAGYDGGSLTAYAGTLHTHTMDNGKIIKVWAQLSKATLTKVKGQPLKANYYNAQNKLLLSLTKDQLSNPLTHDKPWSYKDDDGFRKRSLRDIPHSDQDWTDEQVRVRMSAAFRRTIADWFTRLNQNNRWVPIHRPVYAGSTPEYSPRTNNAEDINIHWNTLDRSDSIGNEPPYTFEVTFSVNPTPNHPNPNMRGTNPLTYVIQMIRDFTAPEIIRYYALVTISDDNERIDTDYNQVPDSFHIRGTRGFFNDQRRQINALRDAVATWTQRINTINAAGTGTVSQGAIAEAMSSGAEHAIARNIIPPQAPSFYSMPFNFVNAAAGSQMMQDLALNDPLPPVYFPTEIWRVIARYSANIDLVPIMQRMVRALRSDEFSNWPWYTSTFDDSNEDHRRLIGYSHDRPKPKIQVPIPNGQCRLCPEKPIGGIGKPDAID
jgi:hypothetical protein